MTQATLEAVEDLEQVPDLQAEAEPQKRESPEDSILTLGIETSCDETSASVLRGPAEVLSNVISSSAGLHKKYGGVVPELASRAHVQAINPAVTEAMSQAGVVFGDLSAISVTIGPGLIGSLVVGVAAAKSLAAVLEKPLVGVNHLEAHIYSNLLKKPEVEFPALALIVSGGHTILVLMHGHGLYQLVGQTLDDAAGEAFDKVARLLGLGFPGGPAIDMAATTGDRRAIAFPRAMRDEGFDFSFSGLKTSVYNFVRKHEEANSPIDAADIAASFQEAAVDVLVHKTLRAARAHGVRTIFLCGGVAANSRLRELLSAMAGEEDLKLVIPAPVYCTDNAAMVACCGYHRYIRGVRTSLDVNPDPNLPLA